MTRSVLFGLASASFVAFSLFVVACSDDDEKPAAVASDASSDKPVDNDPCASYTGVGKACAIARERICFAQCSTGGCYCENGAWACKTDTSCFVDTGFLDDGGLPGEDANVPETTASDAAPSDAAADG